MSARNPKRAALRQLRQRAAEVRELLAEWDPLGTVPAGGPRDEYDCLVWPIIKRLSKDAEDLDGAAEWLAREVEDHFQIRVAKAGAAAVVRRLRGA
jgi:hypothetical protein